MMHLAMRRTANYLAWLLILIGRVSVTDGYACLPWLSLRKHAAATNNGYLKKQYIDKIYSRATTKIQSTQRLKASSSSDSNSGSSNNINYSDAINNHNFDQEETLLKIHLTVLDNVTNAEDAIDALARYSQGFPFAAVLPVQPLTYMPIKAPPLSSSFTKSTKDSNNNKNIAHSYGATGVQIQFLRKKTDEKQAVDGGICFFINSIINDDGTTKDIEITAKRYSNGQFISKIIAEKLIVKAYVAGLTGKEDSINKYGQRINPLDYVQVSSIFHKWM